jgi:CHASE2 domain-containing sensor protein
MVASAYHTKLDSQDWAAHWRLDSVELATVGGLVAVSGVGLWQKRPGALLLFAVAVTLLMVADLAKYFVGYSHYAFELPDLLGTGLCLLAITACIIGFLSMRRRERLSAGT